MPTDILCYNTAVVSCYSFISSISCIGVVLNICFIPSLLFLLLFSSLMWKKVVVMVNATSASQYRVLAASDEDMLLLEDGLPVQMLQDEGQMR